MDWPLTPNEIPFEFDSTAPPVVICVVPAEIEPIPPAAPATVETDAVTISELAESDPPHVTLPEFKNETPPIDTDPVPAEIARPGRTFANVPPISRYR
jgi:hypothetical protein